MAPMTRSRATADGTPTDLMAAYYAQRTEAGLIVSEATNISAQGQGFPNIPGIFDRAHVAGWRRVTDSVHRHGSAFFLQLWHVGRISHPDNMMPGLHPVAPSAIAYERTVVTPKGLQPTPVPHPMTTAEIGRTVGEYGRAARLAVEAGCDGIEIHAANGYLPSQFLHQTTNRRTDGYGGDRERRARFTVEIAEACVNAVGSDRVGIRMTPFSAFNGATSTDERELYEFLIPTLAKLRLAYLHVVGAQVSGNQTVQPQDGEELPDVLAFVRPLWPHALVAAGDYTLARADADIRSGRADLIAFGRDFIGNPDLVTRLRDGHALAPRDPTSWYGSGAQGYTDYPLWNGHEATR